MRAADCPVCRRKRLVLAVQGTKSKVWKIRHHFLPYGEIGERRVNGPCPGSHRKVMHEESVPV